METTGLTLIPLNVVLSELNRLIAEEMEMRGIKCFDSPNDAPNDSIKISLLRPFNTKDRVEGLDLFSPKLQQWAKEIAVKLARPFDVTTFEMEIPRNVHEACIDRQNGIILRGVTDYCIESKYEEFTDRMLYRFDILAKWNDS